MRRANAAAAAAAAAEQVQQPRQNQRRRCSSSSSSRRRRAVEGVPLKARSVCHWSAKASMYAHHDVYGSLYHVMIACGVDDRTCLKRNTLDSIALVLYFRLFGTYVARRSQALGHHGHTHHDIGAA